MSASRVTHTGRQVWLVGILCPIKFRFRESQALGHDNGMLAATLKNDAEYRKIKNKKKGE